MNFLRAVAIVGSVLLVQAGMGQLWPGVHRYVDLLLVPVVLYGLGGSQRAAMLVGCFAGLLSDGWFHVGAFGLSGFKRTLLGFGLGGLATRLDLNNPPGRLLGGTVVGVADSLLDPALRRLIDQQPNPPGFPEIVVLGLTTGLLAALVGSILDRTGGSLADRTRL